MILKCDRCFKNFPFNPDKHTSDKTIYCPHCKNPISNPTKISLKLWTPNLNWIRKKLADRKAKSDAMKFLDKYYPKDPVTNERVFSYRSWRQGKRPRLSIEDIKQVIGGKPSQIEIETEIAWLKKLRVRVTEK